MASHTEDLIDEIVDSPATPAELRKLRFDFAKQLATMNTANFVLLNFIGVQYRGQTAGQLPLVFFVVAFCCFVGSLADAVETMKHCADGTPTTKINHGKSYRAMVFGYIALFIFIVLQSRLPHAMSAAPQPGDTVAVPASTQTDADAQSDNP